MYLLSLELVHNVRARGKRLLPFYLSVFWLKSLESIKSLEEFST